MWRKTYNDYQGKNMSDVLPEIDEAGLDQAIQAGAEFLEEMDRSQAARQVAQEEEQKEETQALATQADPRDADKWGVKALAKEGQSILTGGLQDTASSLATFPERTVDMFTGEMARERKTAEGYRPEWDPFTDHDNPIITKTWWGKLLRGTVHFGSMAAAIIPAAKVTAARTGISLGVLGTNSLIRAAAVGAASDTLSRESDGHNALGALREHHGWFDTPLSTRDTDHPLWMKLKNVVEGMGIGLVFDGASMALGKGSTKVKGMVDARQKSIKVKTIRKGLQELRRAREKGETGFRASKNAPVAEPHQGAFTSDEDVYEVWLKQKRMRNEWGAEDGSAGDVTTPVMRERVAENSGVSEELVEDVLRKLWSTNKFKQYFTAAKGSIQRLSEVFGDSIAAHQRITQGRNAAEMSPAEYLQEVFESADRYEITDIDGKVIDSVSTVTSKNVVTLDLVIGTLLRDIQDIGIAGRELADYADIQAIDGPTKQIFDTIVAALTEVKKARLVKSRNFAALGAGKKQFIAETLEADMKDTRDSILSILRIAKEDPDKDLLNAAFELFSSMKTVNNLDDFDNWARKMIKGGQLDPNGPDRTGALIRELEGVMVQSILSGPKTPLRAIMGTSTATFLRPFSQTIGATMSYPFTSDSTTIRVGLAQLNAMMQALPESFQLFRTKLNSYWSGDIASIKTRFSEFTRGDDNWELLRRYYEDSGRATPGEVGAFRMANLARNLNNNSFLTYSTKLMAATDDAFAYILGRAKMREKAFRSALDSQQKGLIPEINPTLLRFYEDDFYREVFDADGNIIDEATKFARKEVTLTQDLTGFSKGLNDVFTANPWAKPFFLFARTGVNGLKLTAKHTPGFNFLVKEFNDIAFASAADLTNVRKYGITTAAELANAQALQVGRLGIGSAMISLASWSWMSGNLTGNGPTDRQKRQMWIDSGWKPRSIKIGGTWIGYESMEPFNQLFATIGDIGDNSMLMGEEWTEKELLKSSLVVAQGLASKSYLAGMQMWVDLFAGRPGQLERIGASLLNNQVPLSGLRNELGKLFNPHMKELGSGIGQALRNRNLITEYLPGEDLPIKYDMLNGKPIKDWDFMTRAFNAFSPIQLTLDYSPGRQFLFNSGYDMRMSTYYSPNGYDLSDEPVIRSMYQKAIGDQNLERKLDKLSTNRKAQESLQIMLRDIDNGLRGDYDTRDYWHNQKIDAIFDEARRKAWASIMSDPRITELIRKQDEQKKRKYRKRVQTREITPILNMYK